MDSRPEPGRWWFYHRRSWLPPSWYQKWGWPYFGSDELQRDTIIIGFWFLGYVVHAYKDCWCEDCEDERILRDVEERFGADMANQVRLRWMQEEGSRDL